MEINANTPTRLAEREETLSQLENQARILAYEIGASKGKEAPNKGE